MAKAMPLDDETRALIDRYYEVHKDGTVVSKVGRMSGTVMKHKTVKGYKLVCLDITRNVKPRRQKFMLVHRLLALWFIPNPHNLPEVNHIDGDKFNNSLENLEWVTTSDNAKHRYYTGLGSNLGSKNPCAKLTEDQIHTLFEVWPLPISGFLERNKGVAPKSTLRNVYYGTTWVHVSCQYGVVPKVKRCMPYALSPVS